MRALQMPTRGHEIKTGWDEANDALPPEGYAEWKFKEAVEDIVRQCGGNRFIAHGMAVEMVSEVTGVKS